MKRHLVYVLMMIMCHAYAASTDAIPRSPARRIAATQKPENPNHHEPSYFEKYVKPKSIRALVAYCETQWMQQDKDSFKMMPEKVAVNHYHYWSDSWIAGMRVYLLTDSAIAGEFARLKIYATNDQWRFILIALHRQLNHQDIDLLAVSREVNKKRRRR